MNDVFFTSPFVPPEWIAAHQLRPQWLHLSPGTRPPRALAQRGVCRRAGLLVDRFLEEPGGAAIVLTTACDQMRQGAAYLSNNCRVPMFLFNLPSTWQGEAVRALYRDELCRLSRFLEAHGGRAPSRETLQAVMVRHDAARAACRANWPSVEDPLYADRITELRSSGTAPPACEQPGGRASRGVPLTIVGGPLLQTDFALLRQVATAGGTIVLDASEGGERTLPAPFDHQHLADDPWDELVRFYFDTIPDVFRRPNHRFYDWLQTQIDSRKIRGVICWRQLSCDLWHAEYERMRQSLPVPVLDIDAADGDECSQARILGRIEAFVEMLQ